jgi:hypothetical protein
MLRRSASKPPPSGSGHEVPLNFAAPGSGYYLNGSGSTLEDVERTEINAGKIKLQLFFYWNEFAFSPQIQGRDAHYF